MTQADSDLTTRASRANLNNTLYDGDALQRLKALVALHSFVTIGCKDLPGEPLQDAMDYLAEGFDSCVWDVEQERERIERLCIKRLIQRRVRWRRAKR